MNSHKRGQPLLEQDQNCPPTLLSAPRTLQQGGCQVAPGSTKNQEQRAPITDTRSDPKAKQRAEPCACAALRRRRRRPPPGTHKFYDQPGTVGLTADSRTSRCACAISEQGSRIGLVAAGHGRDCQEGRSGSDFVPY